MEDWSDLLHPALRRRVGIVESPREVPIALTIHDKVQLL
jgi:hypothetical protein